MSPALPQGERSLGLLLAALPNALGMGAQVALMLAMSAVAGNRWLPDVASPAATAPTPVAAAALAASGYNEVVVVLAAIDPIMGLAFGANTLLATAYGADPRHPQLIPLAQRALAILLTFAIVVATPLVLLAAPLLQRLGMDPRVAALMATLNTAMVPWYPLLFAALVLASQFLLAVRRSAYVTLPSVAVIVVGPLALWWFTAPSTRPPSSSSSPLHPDGAVGGIADGPPLTQFRGLAYGWLATAAVELAVTVAWTWRDGVLASVAPAKRNKDDGPAGARDDDDDGDDTRHGGAWLSLSESFTGWWPLLRVMAPSCVVIVGGWAAMEVAFLAVGTLLPPCVLAANVVIHQARFAFAPIPVAVYLSTGARVANALGAGDGAAARRTAVDSLRVFLAVLVVQAAALLWWRDPVAHLFAGDDACVATAYRALLPWCVLQAAVEQLAWFHVTLLRTLDRPSAAVTVTLASWWLVGLPAVAAFVYAATRTPLAASAIPASRAIFTGTLVGQAAALAASAVLVWCPHRLSRAWVAAGTGGHGAAAAAWTASKAVRASLNLPRADPTSPVEREDAGPTTV